MSTFLLANKVRRLLLFTQPDDRRFTAEQARFLLYQNLIDESLHRYPLLQLARYYCADCFGGAKAPLPRTEIILVDGGSNDGPARSLTFGRRSARNCSPYYQPCVRTRSSLT